jgi:flagellar basal body P-ring protein FlgI
MDAKANGARINAHGSLTIAEQKLLDVVRQDDLSKVTVQLRQGKILNIETEEDIPARDLDNKTGAIVVRNVADFESVTVSKHKGQVVKARRIRPMPFSDQDNARDDRQKRAAEEVEL